MIYGIHIIAGAAMGKALGPAWLAGLIAFCSHFILDALPHADYPLDSFKSKKPRAKEFWRDAKWVAIDLGLAILIVALVLNLVPGKNAANSLPIIWLIAFIAWLPDVLVALSQATQNKYLLKYFAFHHKVHDFKHTHSKLGLVFEIAVGLVFVGWLVI